MCFSRELVKINLTRKLSITEKNLWHSCKKYTGAPRSDLEVNIKNLIRDHLKVNLFFFMIFLIIFHLNSRMNFSINYWRLMMWWPSWTAIFSTHKQFSWEIRNTLEWLWKIKKKLLSVQFLKRYFLKRKLPISCNKSDNYTLSELFDWIIWNVSTSGKNRLFIFYNLCSLLLFQIFYCCKNVLFSQQ